MRYILAWYTSECGKTFFAKFIVCTRTRYIIIFVRGKDNYTSVNIIIHVQCAKKYSRKQQKKSLLQNLRQRFVINLRIIELLDNNNKYQRQWLPD